MARSKKIKIKEQEISIYYADPADIKPNPDNPRTISEKAFKILCNNIKRAPWMLAFRPIVVDENNIILGGNMRYKACIELKIAPIPYVKASELSDDQRQEFILLDNVNSGEWDFDLLANVWDLDELAEFGIDVPNVSETEKLSKIQYEDVYYTPEEKPHIDLHDCLDLEKFNSKIQVIEKSNLSEDRKELLKIFAYRFIRIDFQSVADYYFFNASEDEKKVIERLRLVLCDSGLNGFIEDDLLMVNDLVQDWEQ